MKAARPGLIAAVAMLLLTPAVGAQTGQQLPEQFETIVGLRPATPNNCPGPFDLPVTFRELGEQGTYREVVLTFGAGDGVPGVLRATDPAFIYEARTPRFDGFLIVEPPGDAAASSLDAAWLEAGNRSLPVDVVRRLVGQTYPRTGTRLPASIRRTLRERGGCAMTGSMDLPEDVNGGLLITFDTWNNTTDLVEPPIDDVPAADVDAPPGWSRSEDGTVWTFSPNGTLEIEQLGPERRAEELQRIPASAPFYRFTSADTGSLPAAWFVRSVDTAQLPIDQDAGIPVVLQAHRSSAGTWSWPEQSMWAPGTGALAGELAPPGIPLDEVIEGLVAYSDAELEHALDVLRSWAMDEVGAGKTIVLGELPGEGDLYGFTGGVFLEPDRPSPSTRGDSQRIDHGGSISAAEGFGGRLAEPMMSEARRAALINAGWQPAEESVISDAQDAWSAYATCPGSGPMPIVQRFRVVGAGGEFPLFDEPAFAGLEDGAETEIYLPLITRCD